MLYGYTTHNIQIIIESLGRIDSNEMEAKELIEWIDELHQASFCFKKDYNHLIQKIEQKLQHYYQIIIVEHPEKKYILSYLLETFHYILDRQNNIYYYQLWKPYFNSELKAIMRPYLIWRGKEENEKSDLFENQTIIFLEHDTEIGQLVTPFISKQKLYSKSHF